MFSMIEMSPYYLICYDFKDIKRYIYAVDMDATSGSRTRIWTPRPEKAHQFKEQIDAELVIEMFFNSDDDVSAVAWPIFPYMFG